MTQSRSEYIVLVHPVSTGFELISRAKERGYQIISVFCGNLDIPNLFNFDTLKSIIEENSDYCFFSGTIEEAVNNIKSVCSRPIAVIPCSEPGVKYASILSKAFGCFGNSIQTAEVTRNKLMLREVINKSGLTSIKYMGVVDEEEAMEYIRKQYYPVVVKSPEGTAQNQVFFASNELDFIDSIRTIFTEPNILGNHNSECLIEEYVQGEEYAVNLFGTGHGFVLTDIWQYEFFENRLYKKLYYNIWEKSAEKEELSNLIEYAVRVAQAVGMNYGPVHIEIMNHPERGPVLIDFNLRFMGTGSLGLTTLQKFGGFNLLDLTIDVFINGYVDTFENNINSNIVMTFHPIDQEGIIRIISGIDTIKTLPSYVSHECRVGLNEYFSPQPYYYTFPFRTLLANKDKQILEHDAQLAHEEFTIYM
ncbi:MAG: ATP-grasp domain-containing protein [Hyphomicrobiales bacterium]